MGLLRFELRTTRVDHILCLSVEHSNQTELQALINILKIKSIYKVLSFNRIKNEFFYFWNFIFFHFLEPQLVWIYH